MITAAAATGCIQQCVSRRKMESRGEIGMIRDRVDEFLPARHARHIAVLFPYQVRVAHEHGAAIVQNPKVQRAIIVLLSTIEIAGHARGHSLLE